MPQGNSVFAIKQAWDPLLTPHSLCGCVIFGKSFNLSELHFPPMKCISGRGFDDHPWLRVRLVVQSCLTLATPQTVCNLPASSVHGILQARILEWVAIPFSSQMTMCI